MVLQLIDLVQFKRRVAQLRGVTGLTKEALSTRLEKRPDFISWVEAPTSRRNSLKTMDAEIARDVANALQKTPPITTDEVEIFRFLIGDPSVELSDLLRGRDSNPQPTGVGTFVPETAAA